MKKAVVSLGPLPTPPPLQVPAGVRPPRGRPAKWRAAARPPGLWQDPPGPRCGWRAAQGGPGWRAAQKEVLFLLVIDSGQGLAVGECQAAVILQSYAGGDHDPREVVSSQQLFLHPSGLCTEIKLGIGWTEKWRVKKWPKMTFLN